MHESELQKLIEEQQYYGIRKKTLFEVNDNVKKILDNKYLRGETPDEMLTRVATAAVDPLKDTLDKDELNQLYYIFYNMMATKDFMPNSPTLMNAGRAFNQLAACFVVPVEDSMEGIFRDAMANMALIQRTGGGTGFDFSELRPKGALVSSTLGQSSGPIPFMRAFNATTDTIKQGGSRRGANMGVLRVDHPDIREFILLKTNPAEMTNFNLSVAVTDEFMEALEKGTKYNLVHNGQIYGEEDATEIWDLIAECAWSTGEPGVLFIDEINRKNTLPGLGKIAATNPCGEQPLLPYEACNLGSINLGNMVVDGEFDFDKLGALTKLVVVFLDCIIDAGTYPLPQIDAAVKANRKIGLGVMGFADVCYELEIAYDSPEAIQWAKSIMAHIDTAANVASQDLGRLRGSFPNIDKSIYANTQRRNAAITTIAPTGTIAMIADASYGIEPFFALSYTKTLTDTGEEITFLNDHIQRYLNKHNFSEALSALVKSYIIENGTIKGVYEAGRSLSGKSQEALLQMEEIFVTAHEVAPVGHVQIQAAFQKHTDNAVSKTINFAEDVSVADIKNIFELAYKRKCKGITVYRDGCRDSQPLKIKKKAEEAPKKHEHPEGLKRPTQLTGVTRQIPTGCGMMLVTVNMDEDGEVFETLMRAGASGGCSAYTDAVARLISIALRYGVPLDVLIDQLRSVRCDNFRYQSGKNPELKGKSCPDVVGRFLQEIVDENGFKKVAKASKVDISAEQLDNILQQAMINTTGAEGEKCPECGKLLLQAEGCLSCQCGYSRC